MGVIARQTIKGSIVTYLGIAIGFVTTFFVLTDCLSASEIGLTRIMVDAAMLFSGLAQLGTSSSIIRFYPYFRDRDTKDHGFFAWSLLLPLFGFSLFTLFFFLCRGGIVSIYSEKSPLFTNYVLHLLPLTFFALYASVFENNANVLMRIAVPKFVREVVIRALNLVYYLLYGHGLVSFDLFVVLFCSSYAVAALLDFLYLVSLGCVSFKPDWHFPSRDLVKDIFSYTLLVTVMGIAGNVQLFNSLFLGAKGGLALAGIYTIAYYISNVVGVPSRSLSAISNPVIAQGVKDGDIAEVNRICKQVSLHQFLVGALIYFLVYINLDALFAVIPNGGEYAAGKSVVLILGFSNLIGQTLGTVFGVLGYSRYYGYSLPFTLILSASAIYLNLTLIPLLGVNGAACATLGGTLIYYLIGFLFVYFRLHVNPLSLRHLRVVVLVALLAGACLLWWWLVSPLFASLPQMASVLLDALCCTVLVSVAAVAGILWLRISPDVSSLILRFIPWCRKS